MKLYLSAKCYISKPITGESDRLLSGIFMKIPSQKRP